MARPALRHAAYLLVPLLLALLAGLPAAGQGRTGSGPLPDNATARSYGDGWVCDQGYRETQGACTALDVPENAYLTDTGYGRGWKCRWGYRDSGQRCDAITVPANAYLNSYGDGWKCHRGYLEANGACEKVRVPENGFYTENSYSRGWDCERGFRAVRQDCLAVTVPANAHLDFSGHDWECDPPYRKQGGACVQP